MGFEPATLHMQGTEPTTDPPCSIVAMFDVLKILQLQNCASFKEQIEKFHNIEKKIWKDEISEMRNLVDAELQSMRFLAGLSPCSLDNTDASSSLERVGDFDDDDSLPLDIDSLKLVVPPDEEGPIIPELYLTQSPESLCNESCSYVRY